MMALAVLALIAGALLAAALAVWRLLRGPTAADRVLALDIFLAAGIALCLAAALHSGRHEYLDVALGLGLVSFITTLSLARLIEHSGPAHAPVRDFPAAPPALWPGHPEPDPNRPEQED